jgi:hypothetical protein
MHLVGRDAKLSLERDAGSPVCLVQTPSWDFGWQNFYEYDAPIDALPKASVSDRFRVRCTYDNTEQNPFLAEALEQAGYSQPIDVPFGESTLSEMCLGAIGVLVPVAN